MNHNNCEIPNCERNLEKLEENLEHNIDKAINNMENNIKEAVNSMEENIQGAVNRMEENIDNALGKNVSNDLPKVAGKYKGTFQHVGEYGGEIDTFHNPIEVTFEIIVKQSSKNPYFINSTWYVNENKIREHDMPGVLRKVGNRWDIHSVSTADQTTFIAELVIDDNNVCTEFSYIATEPGPVPPDPTKTFDYPSVCRGTVKRID